MPTKSLRAIYYNFGQLKLSLAQLVTHQPELALELFQEAGNSALQAIDLRNQAAGYPLKNEKLKDLASGPPNFQKLSEEWNRLLGSYVVEHNRLLELKNSLTARLANTRRWIARSRWLAVSLQIIGLIIVMSKDLPRVSH